MIGAPCRITESDVDLEQNESTFEIDMLGDDPYLDSVVLSVYGNHAEMSSTRTLSVQCPYNMDQALKLGSKTPLGELEGYEPRLGIDMCKNMLIITLSLSGRITDIPKIHILEEVLRAVEFGMLKS